MKGNDNNGKLKGNAFMITFDNDNTELQFFFY